LINRDHLRNADLNLMIVFETLMHERSVTRTASKLSLGQPAVSNSLRRLRKILNDPLFLLVNKRMEPTPRALEIIRRLSPALDAVSVALNNDTEFPVPSCQTTFRIGVSQEISFSLLAGLLPELMSEASTMRFEFIPIQSCQAIKLLQDGVITVAACSCVPGGAITGKTLKQFSYRVMQAKKFARTPLTLESYCRRPHVKISAEPDCADPVDAWLGQLGMRREIAVTVGGTAGLSELLLSGDFIVTIPEYEAHIIGSPALFSSAALPFTSPAQNLNMLWPTALDLDPAQQWIRSRLDYFIGECHLITEVRLPSARFKDNFAVSQFGIGDPSE